MLKWLSCAPQKNTFVIMVQRPNKISALIPIRVTFLKDGVTVLRLISDNAGEMVASEVISDLWQLYKNDSKRAPSQRYEEDGNMSTVSGYSASALLGNQPL
uniref:Innexin n=1 Tax=Parascaris univalens TaxID=6257 RepID=A0A915B1K8_PARUN